MRCSPLVNLMISAAQKSAVKMHRDFYETPFLQDGRKPIANFVGYAVRKAEEQILEILMKGKPEFGIVSGFELTKEADANADGTRMYWVINAMDGVSNYSRAIPLFAISISLKVMKKNGESEFSAGVVNIPSMGEMFIAEKGCGAWYEAAQKGGPQMQLRRPKKLINAPIILTDAIGVELKENADSVRILGSSAISLCYLASSKADKCFLFNKSDALIGAGIIIAKEAGASVTEVVMNGRKFLEIA